MQLRIYIMTLVFLLFGTSVLAQEKKHTEICIDFRVNKTVIDTTYMDNAASLQEMKSFLQTVLKDTAVNIVEVSLCAAASPEGSDQLNRRLAQGRLATLEKLVRKQMYLPDSIITRNDSYIPWNYMRSQVEHSDLPQKDKVLSILDEESRLVNYYYPNTHVDSRLAKLKLLNDGYVWRQMEKRFFAQMRNACIVFVTYKKELPPVQEPVIVPDTITIEPIVEAVEIVSDTTAIIETVIPEVEGWNRKLHLKTNAIGLGMAIANVAAEVDLAKHWSFTLPVYYSAWDYFKSTIKFRTFAVQPEFRYWLSDNNDGFFAGTHLGLAYYNFAFDGDYRYQDHNRETPSLGGGVSIGYRLPVSRNCRWRMEFSLGGGGYTRHYDKFYNTPRTKDGLIIESIRKAYWGIDQAAVSFSYSFDLKKEGVKR